AKLQSGRADMEISSQDRSDVDVVALRERTERVPGLHRVDARRGRGVCRRGGADGRRVQHGDEPRGADAEPRDVARLHGSNSAKRMPNEAKRPVGASQRTVTFSTRESGGPFSSSRTKSWMSARDPSARARTRPSLRFMTKPERPSPSARRCA